MGGPPPPPKTPIKQAQDLKLHCSQEQKVYHIISEDHQNATVTTYIHYLNIVPPRNGKVYSSITQILHSNVLCLV